MVQAVGCRRCVDYTYHLRRQHLYCTATPLFVQLVEDDYLRDPFHLHGHFIVRSGRCSVQQSVIVSDAVAEELWYWIHAHGR